MAGPLGVYLGDITPETIDLSLAAVARGEATSLESGGEPSLLIAPATREVLQRIEISDLERASVYRRLGDALGKMDSVAKLPIWTERPDCRLCRLFCTFGICGHTFKFVIVPRPEQADAVVAACYHHQEWI